MSKKIWDEARERHEATPDVELLDAMESSSDRKKEVKSISKIRRKQASEVRQSARKYGG